MAFKQKIIFDSILAVFIFLIKMYKTYRFYLFIRRFRESRETLECFRSGSRVGIPERDRDFRTLVPTTNIKY